MNEEKENPHIRLNKVGSSLTNNRRKENKKTVAQENRNGTLLHSDDLTITTINTGNVSKTFVKS